MSRRIFGNGDVIMKRLVLLVAALVVLSSSVARAAVFSGAMDSRAGLAHAPGYTAQSLAWIVGGSRGEGLRLEWRADNETTPGFWTYTYTLVRGTARNKGFAFFDIETADDFTAGNLAVTPVVTATTGTGLPVTGITTLGPVNFNQVHDFSNAPVTEASIATVLDKADLSHYSGDPGRSPAGIPGGAASAMPTEGPVPHPFFGIRVTFPGSFANLAYEASDWQIRVVSNRVPMWGDFFGWGDQTFIPPFWYSSFYNDEIDTPERLPLAPVSNLNGAEPYRGWVLVPGPLPAVSATIPADTAVEVPVTEPVSAVFGGLMDPATVSSSTFTLSSGGVPVAGTVSYDEASLTATFTPAAVLAPGTAYSAAIISGAGGVQDLAGNPLAADKVWSFATAAGNDAAAPAVVFQLPGDGNRYVATNGRISARFSEAMDPATLTTASFTVSAGNGPLSGTVAYNPATRTAVMTPNVPLANNTVYTAALTTLVSDVAGNALAQDAVWSFTTIPQETVLPFVSATAPADLAGSVSVFNPVTATFSEDMDPDTINGASFTIAGVTGTVSYDGVTRRASFLPDAPLANSTTYTATITTAVTDLAGNALPLARVWSFATVPPDLVAPLVSATQPTAAAVNVPLDSAVAVSFSERMNPSTIVNPSTFTLTGRSYATTPPFPVSGNIIYNDFSATALFSPAAPLLMGATYTATIGTAATDLAGNALATERTWSFFTLPDGILIPGESGIPTIADALKALRISVELITATQDDRNHGDVAPLGRDNKPQPDGVIDIADALVILRKVVGLVTW